MQIPSGDLAPRRPGGGWGGYRRSRARRRRRVLALVAVLVLLGSAAYAGTRLLDRRGGAEPVAAACTAAPRPAATLGPPPSAFLVRVLNATGRDGLAAQVADALEARGYRVSGTGNTTGAPVTVVRAGPGGSGPARVVADAVGPRVPVVADPAVRGEVRLVLGTDFSRLATPQEVAGRAAARTAAATAPVPDC